MNKIFTFISVFLVMFISSPFAFAADNTSEAKIADKKFLLDIRAANAFFYVPLGKSKTTMAFFTLTNYSNTDLRVISVSSASAKQLRFMPESSFALPAKQTVALKSSGRHVQINDLKTRLSTGDELHLEVMLSNGQKLHLVALAKSAYDQAHSR